MSEKIHWLSLAVLTLILTACGGSSGGGGSSTSSTQSSSSSSSVSSVVGSSDSSSSSVSSDNSSSSVPSETGETGVFIDSAVAGIGYRTTPSERSGVTNSEGEYRFDNGDMVTFFIGDLELPAVTAKGIVTPLDMAGSDDINDPIVINIARLLQSLDADGDPSNGITIPANATTVAAAVDFTLSVEAFAASEAVTNLVANSGSVTTTLISQEDALNHLQDSIEDKQGELIGTWLYQDTSNPDPDRQYHIALIFLDEEHYLIINDEDAIDDDSGMDGFEFGTYTWNVRTGVAEFTVITDTNGEWGFSHPCDESEVITLDIRANTLFLQAEGEVGDNCDEAEEDSAPIELSRVESAPNTIYGSWQIGGPDFEEFAVITLAPNGTYFFAENQPADDVGEPGIERGTYTYDAETSVILFTTLTDTNGQWGLSHSCAALDVVGTNNLACGPEGRDIIETVTADGDTLIFISEVDTILNNGEEDPVEFTRVADNLGDLEMPTDATGTWTIDVLEDATACGAEAPEAYDDTFIVVQEGSALTVTDQFGTYEGSVDGYSLNWSGSYIDEDGTGNLSVSAIFFYEEDGLKISGSTTWSFTASDDPEFTCNGTSTFEGQLTTP